MLIAEEFGVSSPTRMAGRSTRRSMWKRTCHGSGYANPQIRARVEPALTDALRKRGCCPCCRIEAELTVQHLLLPDEPVLLARAPGRLDVMGGIADYSGALVLQLPLARTTSVVVAASGVAPLRRGDPARRRLGTVQHRARVEFATVSSENQACSPNGSRHASEDRWAAYVIGVVQHCVQRAARDSMPRAATRDRFDRSRRKGRQFIGSARSCDDVCRCGELHLHLGPRSSRWHASGSRITSSARRAASWIR